MARTKRFLGRNSHRRLFPIPYLRETKSDGCDCSSPLTATCYFPLLPLLRTHFENSAQAILTSL
ncbi:hypothetical protein BDR22DRAFT_845514 [Usnea florida]